MVAAARVARGKVVAESAAEATSVAGRTMLATGREMPAVVASAGSSVLVGGEPGIDGESVDGCR